MARIQNAKVEKITPGKRKGYVPDYSNLSNERLAQREANLRKPADPRRLAARRPNVPYNETPESTCGGPTWALESSSAPRKERRECLENNHNT